MSTQNHLQKFYTGVSSMLHDTGVLTAVSTFLQCSRNDLIKVLLERANDYPYCRNEAGYKKKEIKHGYYQHVKKEEKKLRYITEPLPLLRDMQEKIVFLCEGIEKFKKDIKKDVERIAHVWHYSLHGVLPSSIQPHGTRLNESTRLKAGLHTSKSDNPYFIPLDIKNAYGSLSEERIYVKLTEILQPYFTKIPFNSLDTHEIKRSLGILSHLLTYDGYLATGSPASPYIFQTILSDLDKKIIKFLNTQPLEGFVFTRYADDISVSFANINTPTLVELKQYNNELYDIYREISKGGLPEEITDLHPLLYRLRTHFRNNDAQFSDEHNRKLVREILHTMRTIMVRLKGSFSMSHMDRYESIIKHLPGVKIDAEVQHLIDEMKKYFGFLSEPLEANLTKTIGALDIYKRRMDNSEVNFPTTLENIEHGVRDVIKNDGWQVNEDKSGASYPHSSGMKTMLGIGITNKGKVTVPQNRIYKKIESYYNMLTNESLIPKKFIDARTGEIKYDSIFLSIYGYKKYIMEMKLVEKLARKRRMEFRKIERMSAAKLGMTYPEAYELFIKDKRPDKEGEQQSEELDVTSDTTGDEDDDLITENSLDHEGNDGINDDDSPF